MSHSRALRNKPRWEVVRGGSEYGFLKCGRLVGTPPERDGEGWGLSNHLFTVKDILRESRVSSTTQPSPETACLQT